MFINRFKSLTCLYYSPPENESYFFMEYGGEMRLQCFWHLRQGVPQYNLKMYDFGADINDKTVRDTRHAIIIW